MNSDLCRRIGDLKASMDQQNALTVRKADAALDIPTKARTEVDQLHVEVAQVKKWYKKLQVESETVQSQANRMETYNQRDNIIIYGIKERPTESVFLCQKAV